MVGAIVQGGLQADQRIACQNALDYCVAQTLFNRGEEVLGHGAAEDFLCKNHVVLLILGLEANPNVTELTGTTGLLLVTAVNFNAALNLFAVCNTCGLKLGVNIVQVLELGAENAKLNVACAGNHHLVSLGVVNQSKGNVFLVELIETCSNLVVLTLGLGSDAHGVAGFGNGDGGQLICILVGGNGVAGLPVHLADGNDVAAAGFADFGVLLAAHIVQAAQLVVGGSAQIVESGACLNLAGENLYKAELTELVGHGLEYEAQNAVVLLFGSGAVVNNALQHGGGTYVGHSVAGKYGNNGALLDANLETFNHVSLIQLHGVKELLHQFLGSACGSFHKLGAQFLCSVSIGCGDGGLLGLCALGDVSHIVYQVDNAGTVGGGDGHGADNGAVLALEGIESLEVVAVLLVALGNGEHNRQLCILKVVPVALCANGNGLGSVLGGGDDHAALHCAQCAENIAHEVKVTGAVQNVNLCTVVVYGCDGGGDSYLAAGFFCVVVADGGAVSYLAHTVDSAGAEKHALCKAGLTVVAVANKADVANVLGFVAHVLLIPLYQICEY